MGVRDGQFRYVSDGEFTRDIGDTVDFVHIKRHCYMVHTDVSPTRIVPDDLSGWSSPHGREALGGHPFGTGTPPDPPVPDELVPIHHRAA